MKMKEPHSSNKDRDVTNMADEGLAAAGELRSAMPDYAATIYCMLGDSFCKLGEYVKSLGLLEQARALAVEAGDRSVLGRGCLGRVCVIFVQTAMHKQREQSLQGAEEIDHQEQNRTDRETARRRI